LSARPAWIWYLVALGGCALLVALLTPPARAAAHRLGLVDHPDGRDYKWHGNPTAYLGGIVIMLIVIGISVGIVLSRSDPPRRQFLAILGGAALCGAIGAWDDWRPLGWTAKLLPVVAAASLLWVSGIRSALTGIPDIDFLITVLWVVGVTHALNIIDNMDGVAAGLAAIASLGVFVIAVGTAQWRVAMMAAALCGACLGFLPFNTRGATMFLGDAGTLFLGFLLSALGLVLNLSGAARLTRFAVPVLLLAVPLFNMVLVIVSRVRRRRPVVRGATDGMSHRLILMGLGPTAAAAVFWISGAVMAAAAVATLHLPLAATLAESVGLGICGVTMVALFERVYGRTEPVARNLTGLLPEETTMSAPVLADVVVEEP
jgi:UDP-GlcNAc:undecaprenyl-phosphate GlcNAc-1-phosphate transferase